MNFSFIVEAGVVLWLLIAMSIYSLACVLTLFIYAKNKGILACKGPVEMKGTWLHEIKSLTQNTVSKSNDDLQSSLNAHAFSLVSEFRGRLRILEVISACAPLLGLLGTVIGMIEAFSTLSSAGNDINPGLLAGGIWKALLTTAAGLIVALPALVAWHAFDRRVENQIALINQYIVNAKQEVA